MRPFALLPLLAVLVALAGCGGGGSGSSTKAQTAPAPAPTLTAPPTLRIPSSVDPASAHVIRTWADTLRHGNVSGAANEFALPSTVANGGSPIRLATRAASVSFNNSLVCGARVTRLEPSAHDFVVATFTLTERPGTGVCGSGAGHTARVAFLIRDGLINEWIRLEDVPSAPASPGEPA
ncbi:MAG TPA: hypothetical protein VGM91_11745 [Conexibacter sp.]|jgi:hypothetical protein